MREWQKLLNDLCTESMCFVVCFFLFNLFVWFVSSADNLCSQFGPRSDCTFVQMRLMLD